MTPSRPPWPYPRWIAHRGAGRLAPENTLAAFRLGAQHGYRMFECDAKLSSDGVVFLMHDATLERTTNGQGIGGEQPWSALAQLDAGAWHSRQYAGEPLPLRQDEIRLSGHSFEARLYAEDASRGFLPATGTLHHLAFPPRAPAGAAMRIETGVRQGDAISPYYDPMIAKVLPRHGGGVGATRASSRRLMAYLLGPGDQASARAAGEPGIGPGNVHTEPRVVAGRYGLSSKEFTPAMIKGVFDNLSQGHRAAVHPQAVFVQGDLADRAAIDAVIRLQNRCGVPTRLRDTAGVASDTPVMPDLKIQRPVAEMCAPLHAEGAARATRFIDVILEVG